MNLKTIIKSIFCILSAITLCSCTNTKYTRDFFAMDTIMHLEAYGDEAEVALDECEEYINTLGKELDRKGEGCIGQLNKNKSATLSDDALDILKLAIEYGNESDGALNILLANASDTWGFYTKEYNVPTADELAIALQNTSLDNIKIDGNIVTIPEGVCIDLGAIAKGYTASRVREIFKKHNVKHAIATLGGNVVTIGEKTDGTDWNIGIKDPLSQNDTMGSVFVSDRSVVTSGAYERYFERDGKTYHHILDPSTGYPVDNGIASVTIISKNDTLADALSTAVFVMGKEKALTLYNKRGDFEYIIIDNEGRVNASKGATLQTK